MNKNFLKILGVSIAALVGLGLFSFVSAQEGSKIPSWLKQTALFWGEDKISEREFISALQFLVENKILVIPPKQSSSDQINNQNSNNETTLPPKVKTSLTIQVDQASYVEGDTALVTGEATGDYAGFNMSLTIIRPDGLFLPAGKVIVNPDNTFSRKLELGGSSMAENGTYSLVLKGVPNNEVTTTFSYTVKENENP
jgi:hypothetical protein